MWLMISERFRTETMWRMPRASHPWLLLLPLFVQACDQVDQIQNDFRELTPHEAYFESLSAVGLAETALGTEWATVAATALSDAPSVGLPFVEEGFLFAETPEARSYRVGLRRGQRLSIDVTLEGTEPARVFVDVYRLPADASLSPLPVLSSESESGNLEYVSTRQADYVVRLQPELLRGGRYRIDLRVAASLVFPVQDRSARAILSVFGDDRDGGRRQHRGVDIFAPRGTPVLSATDGRVSRVRTTPVGGKVVWVNDSEQPQRIYYAHLDSQVVQAGAIVKRGDLLGMVGNTGNARTTPPHLHFSVYQNRRGAVDPYYFVYQPAGTLPDASAPLDHLGTWTRTVNEGIRLRSAPSRRSTVVAELEEHTPLRVLAATGSWYRVRLPDGQDGFVAARLTEATNLPLRNQVIANASDLVSGPSLTAPVMESVEAGTGVSVLGSFDGFLYVQSPRGYTGWMAGDSGLN
jgi:murein DD-endopeptidase MepM/ murein hydrolase activator NlpD